MAVYKRDIADINLETGNIQRTFLNHSIGLHDKKADHFGIRVFRNGEPVDLSGVSVQGVFMPPQGDPIAITSGNIISGNVAEVVLPDACYNYDGQFCLAIRLVDVTNSVTDTVRIVDGVVDNTHSGGTISPLPVEPTWAEIKAAYEQAVTVIDKSVRFDTTQSLTDTQKATARTNIGSASVGTANELAMDIGALAEGFANESYMDLGNKYMPFRRGYYSTPAVGSTSSYQSNSQYFYALVMCQPGDILHAHCYGNSTVYAWAFLDSNLKVLSRGGTGNFEGTQTAPASTSYVLVNVDISHMSTGFYAWVGEAATGDQISDLKSALKTNSLTSFYGSEKVIGNGIISLDDVGYWKTTSNNGATEFIYLSYYRSAKVPCSSGDVFVINTYGAGGNYRAWAFIDSNNNIVTRCDNAYANDEIVTAPNTAVYLLINNNLNNRATGYYAFKNSTTTKSTVDQIKNDANSMIYYQALTTTDDLDALTRSGLYAWGSSNVPQNCPVNAGCKLLCMYVNNANITQIIVPSDDYFVLWRYKTSTGWNEWEAIPDRTYIDNEIVRIDRLISDSFADKYNPVSITGESGYYWNRETDTAVKTAISSYTAYAPVSVQAGEKYSAYIYSASSSKQRPVLLVDDNYLIKQSYLGTKNAYNTFSIIIPNGVTKILLCTDSSHASTTKLNKVTVQSECDAGMFNFKNANIAIIGDSISTNGNYSASNLLGNVPEIVIKDEDVGVELSAYATYYDIGTTVGGHEIVSADVGTEITFTPVEEDVGKFVGKPKNNNDPSVVTWWEVAQAVLGFNPIPVCWSGSSITSHEGTDNEYKTSYAWHPAQIRKCGIRTPGTMTRTAPDMVIIYRGTNDFSHSPYSKLTADYFDSYPWTYPNTDAVTGGYGYKEGLCLTIRKLREAYPMAKIVLCTCNFFKRVNYSSYPINNGEYTENQLNNAIREVANYMGCGLIEFDKDGLTYENASSTYYQDSAAFTHPTTAGHKILGTKALRDLMSQNNMN